MTVTETPRGGRLPLSFNQELLCMFDSGDSGGPFGPRYQIIAGRRVRGPLDPATLDAALADLVRRHEPLRTNVVRGIEPHQEVFPPSRPRLDVRDCPGLCAEDRDLRAESFLLELEAELMPAEELPHLRAALLRFDEQDAVLALVTHHIATDGFSMGVLVRDLAMFYAARRAGVAAALPPMEPYREFVAWERERATYGATARARAYWQRTLQGARFTALPADYPRSLGLPQVTSMHRFELGVEMLDRTRRVTRLAHCSPFMMLLAAYCRIVQQITGLTDLVVSTHTLGRPVGRFDNTVGSFFNFLPLRVDVGGSPDGPELLRRVRRACFGAFEHEIPAVQIFEVAPDLMAPAMEDGLTAVTFQAFPEGMTPATTAMGELTYTVVPRREVSQAVTSDIPDGAVWSIRMDPAQGMSGNLTYCTNRFDQQTILRLAGDYHSALRSLLCEVEAPSGAA